MSIEVKDLLSQERAYALAIRDARREARDEGYKLGKTEVQQEHKAHILRMAKKQKEKNYPMEDILDTFEITKEEYDKL